MQYLMKNEKKLLIILGKAEPYMEENNVILNKIEAIERFINRINIVYENNPENLKDYTKQDSIHYCL